MTEQPEADDHQPPAADVVDTSPASSDDWDPPDQRLQRIEKSIADIELALREANELAAGRQRVIDRLHEENQRLRTGERQLLLRPVLTDLYRLHVDLLRQAATLSEELTRDQVVTLLTSFAHSVEFTLERCGVRLVRPTVGEAFDPHVHRVAEVSTATAPEQDGQITEVLSAGYLDTISDRTLAAAAVRVARWTAPDPTPDPDSTDPERESDRSL